MITFTPKIYQEQVLDSVEAYFKSCHELPAASIPLRLWETLSGGRCRFVMVTDRKWDAIEAKLK